MNKNWIDWNFLSPPKDVKGIFIKFSDDKIWTDSQFYGSAEYKNKTIGNAIPIQWTFIDRRNENAKSIRCDEKNEKFTFLDF